jgi:hypothetical protein
MNMLKPKNEKKLSYVFTSVSITIYLILFGLILSVYFADNSSYSIESLTLMALQILGFVLLLIGMVFKKNNLILGTLVASLVSTVVSYLISDMNYVLSNKIDFSSAWYSSTFSLADMTSDVLLSIGAVGFLIYLMNGRKQRTGAFTSTVFLIYVFLAAASLIFLAICSFIYEGVVSLLLSAGVSFLAPITYLTNIKVYFFNTEEKKKGQEKEEELSSSKEFKKYTKESLEKIDDVIYAYQTSILSSSYSEKDGHNELTVDLTSIPLYEDCSNSTLLNQAIYSFVENVAFAFKENFALSVRFLFPSSTSLEERKKVDAIFHAHYAISYKKMLEQLTKEMVLAITFVFIGFLLITFHLPYSNANSNSVYGEMLDIFGWVFTWEAVEILCVNQVERQAELHRYRTLYTASIVNSEKN